MTPFEIIILFMYWQFATTYTYENASCNTDTITDRVLNMLFSMTCGAIWFPAIFADKIWNKLNKQ